MKRQPYSVKTLPYRRSSLWLKAVSFFSFCLYNLWNWLPRTPSFWVTRLAALTASLLLRQSPSRLRTRTEAAATWYFQMPDRLTLIGRPMQQISAAIGARTESALSGRMSPRCRQRRDRQQWPVRRSTLRGQPVANITIKIQGRQTRTDGTGRFLLTEVPAGRHVMLIDGRSASRPGATYGIFKAAVDITDSQTNVLPYTIWMPKLDMAHATTISSPTQQDVVLTTPMIPGLELHLPAGTVIRDINGRPVTQISITPVPVDRSPFPLPNGFKVPVFASIQPGGAQIISPRARLVIPITPTGVPVSASIFLITIPKARVGTSTVRAR